MDPVSRPNRERTCSSRFSRHGPAARGSPAGGRRILEFGAVFIGFTVLVAAFTWPQLRHLCCVPDLGDPLSAAIVSERRVSVSRDKWNAGIHVQSRMRSDSEAFLVDVELTATSQGARVFGREWRFRIARDLV